MSENNMLTIPGWNGNFDSNQLCTYEVEFNRNDIQPSTLNYFISKGEYVFAHAIGVIKQKNRFLIVTNVENLNDKIVTIKNIIGDIGRRVKIDGLNDRLAFEAFFHSLIDQFFISIGFEKPNDIRTFLGKSSKGKLSDRRPGKEIATLDLTEDYSDSWVKIYKSVNHQVFINSTNFFITMLPNFEVYGNYLDLPLTESQKNQLENYREWNDCVYMNPDTFLERFAEYSSALLEFLKGQKPISIVRLNTLTNVEKLTREEDFFIQPLEKSVHIESNNSFESQMFHFFKENYSSLPKITIIILIDKFSKNLEENSSFDEIDKYIKKLEELQIFKIKRIDSFSNIREYTFDKENYYVIINDKIPGFQFVHDYVKKNTKISKCVLFSTISSLFNDTQIHDENSEEQILLIWLSFYYRLNNKLIWYKKKEWTVKRIVSLNIYNDYSFNQIRLMLSILNLNTNLITENRQIFILPSMNEITPDALIMAILRSLKSDFDFPNVDDFLLIQEGQFSQDLVSKVSTIASCALIKKVYSRLLIKENGTYHLPLNGIFYRIFESSNIFLLNTTGFPDNAEKGIPNPISIEFFNSNKIPDKLLLQLIYDLSFYQPVSFAKSSFPFLISLNQNDIFANVPIKFSDESPF